MPTASTGVPDRRMRSRRLSSAVRRASCSGVSSSVGEIEIIRAKHFEENRRAKTVGPAVLRFDRLVDDIPAVHHSAIPAGEPSYALDDRTLDLQAAGKIEKPGRGAVIPEQIMPAQRETVLVCEGRNRICRAVVVITARAAVHVLPFHIVLGNDDTRLLQHK